MTKELLIIALCKYRQLVNMHNNLIVISTGLQRLLWILYTGDGELWFVWVINMTNPEN